MKLIKILAILAFVTAHLTSCQDSAKSNLALLSNQIPTDTPLKFSEGIISTDDFEFAITFSPEMDELYFTRRKPDEDNVIFTMRLIDGQWTKPEVIPFTAKMGWDFEPHINPSGDKLYFGSLRPLPDSTESSGLHQWYSEKSPRGWSEPKPLDKPFIDRFVMYMTSSGNGNLYFTSNEKGAVAGEGGIYNSIFESGQYRSVNRMGNEIDSVGTWIAHPYIAPDESYVIYDAKSPSGYGNSDLYISFNKNGTWSKPVNMGSEINTEQTEMCASVSPDGKYLFFHRGIYEDDGKVEIGDIYWVDFNLIKKGFWIKK